MSQTLCCNPVPGDLLETRLGLVTGDNPLGDDSDYGYDDYDYDEDDEFQPSGKKVAICEAPQLKAVVNFNFGVTCGKRDSR